MRVLVVKKVAFLRTDSKTVELVFLRLVGRYQPLTKNEATLLLRFKVMVTGASNVFVNKSRCTVNTLHLVNEKNENNKNIFLLNKLKPIL